ncbi:MAG: Rho termination factor N-terminal domain-containing protein [Intrasporangium sp.]|uniref:Rho termination factor N-terminal domain-containing protein n=1 Tax=Intrasporangium sp. TaxID=1925024 RepID=UPI003F800C88
MADKPGNPTPDTPDVGDTELRELTVAELRERAKKAGVPATSKMKKDELGKAVTKAGTGGGRSEDESGGDVGAGPERGHVRTGGGSSDSLRYSQEVTSPEDEPERPGRSLVTTHHEVIRRWAEKRGGRPATVAGTEHGDHLGVLRFDFGDRDDTLREVSWDEWFATFDDRQLNFIYQEETSDGEQSNFFRLENPEREDA